LWRWSARADRCCALLHHPYFAVPLGDMMIAGCFGLLRAYADRFPDHAAEILASLHGSIKPAVWETA